MWRNLFLLAFSIVGLAGCTDTAQFQQPITTFSSAADSAATSFAALDAASTTNLNAIRANEVLKLGRVGWSPSDCAANSKACRLYFGSGQTDVYVSSLMPKSVAFVSAIKGYADALDAVEKADASSKVQSAFADSMNAIGSVASAVGMPAGAVAKTIATPLSSVVGWGFLQYQNDIKLEALQKATAAAESVIQAGEPILDHELTLAANAQTDELAKNFQDKDQAFSTSPTAVNLQAEIAAANALNTALTAKTADYFKALATAHSKLADAVRHPGADLSDVIAAVTAFAQQAKNVEDAINALKTPAKK